MYKECLEKREEFILEYADHHFCNHFEEKFGLDCDLGIQTKEFDLVSYYSDIEMEKRDGNLIPDLRLINPKTGESLYIEIAVTHEVEDVKRGSGKKIVEFLINEESDLELIKAKRILLNEERIRRYNFKGTFTKKNFCKGNCNISRNVFIVYKSGKSILVDKKLSLLNSHIENGIVEYFKFSEIDFNFFHYREKSFVLHLIESHEKGVKVKNCFLCRYHARNKNPHTSDSENIFCKFLKEACQSNYAAECDYFRSDKDAYAEYLEEY